MLLVAIVTGAQADPTYKSDFEDQQVFTLTSSNYSGYITAGWMSYTGSSTGSATLTIDPATDEAITGSSATYGKVKYDGSRYMEFYVTGISAIKFYFANSGSSDRKIQYKLNGGTATDLVTVTQKTSNSGEIELDDTKKNTIRLFSPDNDVFVCALKVTVPSADASGLEITPESGSYVGKVSVSMTANEGYSIYYTDNGDDPTDGSTEYTGAFDVTTDKTIKAIAYSGTTSGRVKTAEYSIITVGSNTVYDFTAPTAADLAALRANTAFSDNETDYISNAAQWDKNTDHALEASNGTDISVANGLLFGRSSNLSAGSFRYYYKQGENEAYSLYFHNSSSYVKVPNVKKGQSVIITLSAGGDRTFSADNSSDNYSYTSDMGTASFAFKASADGTVTISNSNGGFYIYKIEVGVTEEVTIGTGGYSTYSSDYNYVIVDGATALAAQNKANSVGFTEIAEGTVIPANTGVVLQGTEGDKVSIKLTTEDAGSVTTDMVGVTEANPYVASDNVYVIATKAAGTKFYKYTGATFPVGKAYLNSAANTDALDIDFGQATAVEAVAEANAEASAPIKVIKNGKLYIGNFNVAGQQVK